MCHPTLKDGKGIQMYQVNNINKIFLLEKNRASLVGQMLKNLPAMKSTWVLSLGWEDPLEKEMATHSSILAWRTPWTEGPRGLESMGSQRLVRTLLSN